MTQEIINFEEKIITAKKVCMEKVMKLNVDSLDISEYNKRKWMQKRSQLKTILDLYGHLILLSLPDNIKSINDIVLVDYGGGCGLLSFLAKEMGIGEVVYNDVYEGSCSDVKIMSNIFELPLDHIVSGDIGELFTYVKKKSIKVDSIVSYDVLEHIYNIESHFKQLRKISNFPFVVIYASGANIKNILTKSQFKKLHLEAEYQNRDRKYGHKETDSSEAYFNIRKRIISSYSPDLSMNEVEELTKATRGLIKSDIELAVDEYHIFGFISYSINHPTNTCDPYSGSWMEQLIDIGELQKVLKQSGFSCDVNGGIYFVDSKSRFTHRLIKCVLNLIIRLFGSHSLVIAPYYIVKAKPLI